jgi:LacI family transcriptional regulator
MSTIREVAEQAGVSLTTVSHVINRTRFVSDETREKVLAAMNALDYRPNALAQSLRSGKTHTLGLILPDSANPFYAEIGRHVEEYAFGLGYSVIFCNTERDIQKETKYVELLSDKQVDGVIFVATGMTVTLEPLFSRKMPVVVCDREFPEFPADTLLTDNLQGGYLIGQHLLDLGHRRIACISGPSHITPGGERLIGFKKALMEGGLAEEDISILCGDYHPESGRELALELLSQAAPPTAIFACNDLMAFGVLEAAYICGRTVPEELSVVGFDDIDLASFTVPPLTTVCQPKDHFGYRSVQLLVERIADKTLPIRREILPVSLTLRKSTGPIK